MKVISEVIWQQMQALGSYREVMGVPCGEVPRMIWEAVGKPSKCFCEELGKHGDATSAYK